MMSRFIIRFLFKIEYIYNKWYNRTVLRSNNTICKGNLTITGRIIIKNKGKIQIGENVKIHNNSRNNPVGLPHPTILYTQNPDAQIIIGNNVGISGASIVAASSIVIGDRVLIGGGAGIWDTDFHPLDSEQRMMHPTSGTRSKPIVIEDDVFIGARAIILKGVKIGRAAIIGAGSVVRKDVSEGECFKG